MKTPAGAWRNLNVDMEEDLRLVAALRAGEETATVELVGLYGEAMFRVARRLVQSPALAEDVVQETWLAVLKGIDRFQFRSSLRTWIFRILLNKARTQAMRRRRVVNFSELPLGHPTRSAHRIRRTTPSPGNRCRWSGRASTAFRRPSPL